MCVCVWVWIMDIVCDGFIKGYCTKKDVGGNNFFLFFFFFFILRLGENLVWVEYVVQDFV